MRKEKELGSIEKGKAADMIVLDRNLLEIAGTLIPGLAVLNCSRDALRSASGE